MEDFNTFIKRLIVGANDVFFRDVVEASTKCKILPVDPKLNEKLLIIKKTFRDNLKEISSNVEKNYTGRANELSNYMECVVFKQLENIPDFRVAKPSISIGRKQTAGYPDLLVTANALNFYLEVKTFQLKTADSSLRTFYYKPSESSKVNFSCPHVLISFEVESLGKDNKSPFRINNFKLIDLYKLKVNLKPEFNASNVELYSCRQI